MKRGIFHLLLGGAILLFTLCLVEIALRISGSYYTPLEIYEGEFVDSYSNQFKSWYHIRIPSKEIKINAEEFDYVINTNSEGMVDKEHPITKPTDEYRILTLGDSFTEGFGAPQNESWPHQLQKLINADSNFNNIAIIQGGVVGSDPFCAYVLLRDKLLKYKPDLVIQTTNHTDLGDAIVFGGMDRFLPDTTIRKAKRPLLGTIYKHSHIGRWGFNTFFSENYSWLYLSYNQHDIAEDMIIEEYDDLYQKYNQLSNQTGFKMVVLIHPMPEEADSMNYHDSVKKLITKIDNNKIPIIDGLDYFNCHIDKKEASNYYWPLDGHHNEQGYELIANAVKEWLEKNNTELMQ